MSGCEEWQTVKSKKKRFAEDKSEESLTPWEPAMEIHGEGGPLTTCWLRSTKEFQLAYGSPEGKALQQVKNAIHEEAKWDDFKKITNPYEYVFLSWNRRSSRSVSTKQPLSRSYFKMIELWKQVGLTQEVTKLVDRDGGLKTAHAAEGPGGFIEAC